MFLRSCRLHLQYDGEIGTWEVDRQRREVNIIPGG